MDLFPVPCFSFSFSFSVTSSVRRPFRALNVILKVEAKAMDSIPDGVRWGEYRRCGRSSQKDGAVVLPGEWAVSSTEIPVVWTANCHLSFGMCEVPS